VSGEEFTQRREGAKEEGERGSRFGNGSCYRFGRGENFYHE